MSKDQTIAELRETVAALRADKQRLLDMLQLALSSRHAQDQRAEEHREMWREQKRRKREMSANCPPDIPPDIPPDKGGTIGGDTVLSLSKGDVPGTDTPEEKQEPGESAERGSAGHSRGHGLLNDADWLTFREQFPRTDRTSWPVAEQRFKRLSKTDKTAALAGVAKYHPEPQFVKGAQSWISERRWETVDDRPASNGNGVRHMEFPGIDAFMATLSERGEA